MTNEDRLETLESMTNGQEVRIRLLERLVERCLEVAEQNRARISLLERLVERSQEITERSLEVAQRSLEVAERNREMLEEVRRDAQHSQRIWVWVARRLGLPDDDVLPTDEE